MGDVGGETSRTSEEGRVVRGLEDRMCSVLFKSALEGAETRIHKSMMRKRTYSSLSSSPRVSHPAPWLWDALSCASAVEVLRRVARGAERLSAVIATIEEDVLERLLGEDGVFGDGVFISAQAESEDCQARAEGKERHGVALWLF